MPKKRQKMKSHKLLPVKRRQFLSAGSRTTRLYGVLYKQLTVDSFVLSPSLQHQCVLPKMANSIAKNHSSEKLLGLIAAENALETIFFFFPDSIGLCQRCDLN